MTQLVAQSPHAPELSPVTHLLPPARRDINTTDGVVSVTARAWGVGFDEDGASDDQYAQATMRDAFLCALDAADAARSRLLASGLVRCGNPLPGLACLELGLPLGSTYGSAARRVLARGMRSA
jgi:hypothetical protein